MNNITKTFTLEEVAKLVKNAYEVGYCDGIDVIKYNEKDYLNADDFWSRNVVSWTTKEITYIV